ncbi:RNA exonuclease 3 [Scheffersomyces spartinae]|uniref:RNA exonuclease 3 n=1 Tax=Scheffersomyces spartinae TaxID=45513 RepID=A0A9P8AGD7_9ASCO|nr:RNA exonuclease 3 [Scheffersomyces spartinae]KAG7191272.1 RNA exonuclease 3 [Scheffersomyces spartinae]
MFRFKNGYFSKVDCPKVTRNEKCNLLGCIFKHPQDKELTLRKRPTDSQDDNIVHKKADIKSDKTPESEPEKENDIKFLIPKQISHILISRAQRIHNVKLLVELYRSTSATPNKQALQKEYDIITNSRSIETYQNSVDKLLGKESGSKLPFHDPKHILPKAIVGSGAPAMLPERRKFIELMVESIKKSDPSCKTPISKAIDEEFKIAVESSSSTYKQHIKRKLYELQHPEKAKNNATLGIVIKDDIYWKYLNEVVIPVKKLAQFGYIMEIPKPLDEVKDERICRRCKNDFKLSEVTNKVQCHYHPGKFYKVSKNLRRYDCCGGESMDDTCTVGEHHVFYWDNPEEMNHAIPFKKTKDFLAVKNSASFKCLGVDCEMGFTSMGFELLRITAIDFFSGEEVLDLLVKPKGQVLDLNTKWSGIARIEESAMDFNALIELLGEIMDQQTILIGHGLENDMNTMRLIHDRIIDTAVLYPPHKATPTFRYSLKQLSFEYLGRTIQSGEHDSGEDALSAIDIVKHFLRKSIEQDIRNQ